jgi:hypothetical protein
MAWELPQISCRWLRGEINQPDGAVESPIAKVIAGGCGSLSPGDALLGVKAGHIMLFRKWVDKAGGVFEAWEQAGTAEGTIAGDQTFTVKATGKAVDMTGEDGKTDRLYLKHRSVYQCIRRRKVDYSCYGPEVDIKAQAAGGGVLASFETAPPVQGLLSSQPPDDH